ncbi:MAG: lipase family protein [Scytolyngbya sp. HA4215-MV1]|jgi:triacylglycerol lipase|nr:lipase family protein [Scytolyngbya sp. HA4215-MV1]
MANQPDPKTTVGYGKFVAAAYSMFQPGVLNPPANCDFPQGYQLLATIQMTDFFGEDTTRQFYGFIAQGETNPLEIVIALRGTEDLMEWWDDFHFLPTPFLQVSGGGNVATGFLDIYNTFGIMTPQQLEAESAPSKNFASDVAQILQEKTGISDLSEIHAIAVGHSLGGALTTLYALDIASNNGLKPDTYTFASPRVGDDTFKQCFDSHVPFSWRIYNHYDIVTDFPKDPFDNYAHVEREYRVGSDAVRWSISCEHALNTYLFLVDPQEVHLDPACQSK